MVGFSFKKTGKIMIFTHIFTEGGWPLDVLIHDVELLI
jgi:hypothetical protein